MNVIVFALIIALASFAGVLFVSKTLKEWLFKNMPYLVTFAAGTFLMTALGMATEAMEILSQWAVWVSIAGGFIFLWLLHMILPEVHHHHDKDCSHCRPSNKGIKILVGDGIHNIADGIVLVAAFSASTYLGIVAAISIFIHEFIQEISEYFVLRSSGYTHIRALLLNFFSALTIFIGVGIGFLLAHNHTIEGILLGIAAGAFLHVVAHDLIPYHQLSRIKHKKAWKHIIMFLLGFGIILFVGYFAPHAHDHEEDHTHHEQTAGEVDHEEHAHE
jgi:zinc and cadmium transporter